MGFLSYIDLAGITALFEILEFFLKRPGVNNHATTQDRNWAIMQNTYG